MVPARSRGRTLPRSRGLAFVPFVVARAGGSIHFALFRRGKGLSSNDERPGKVQKSTFSDDRQQAITGGGRDEILRGRTPRKSRQVPTPYPTAKPAGISGSTGCDCVLWDFLLANSLRNSKRIACASAILKRDRSSQTVPVMPSTPTAFCAGRFFRRWRCAKCAASPHRSTGRSHTNMDEIRYFLSGVAGTLSVAASQPTSTAWA